MGPSRHDLALPRLEEILQSGMPLSEAKSFLAALSRATALYSTGSKEEVSALPWSMTCLDGGAEICKTPWPCPPVAGRDCGSMTHTIKGSLMLDADMARSFKERAEPGRPLCTSSALSSLRLQRLAGPDEGPRHSPMETICLCCFEAVDSLVYPSGYAPGVVKLDPTAMTLRMVQAPPPVWSPCPEGLQDTNIAKCMARFKVGFRCP